jgi:hypothetical protein
MRLALPIGGLLALHFGGGCQNKQGDSLMSCITGFARAAIFCHFIEAKLLSLRSKKTIAIDGGTA